MPIYRGRSTDTAVYTGDTVLNDQGCYKRTIVYKGLCPHSSISSLLHATPWPMLILDTEQAFITGHATGARAGYDALYLCYDL